MPALVGTPHAGVNAFGASVTVSVDAAVANGNLLIAMINGYGAALGPATPNTPAGWTLVGVKKSAGTVGSTALGLYTRVANSEPASYSLSNDDSSGLHYVAASIIALRDVSAGIFDQAPVSAAGSGSPISSPDPGSTVTDHAWHMIFVSSFDGVTSGPDGTYTDIITYDGSPPSNLAAYKAISPPADPGTQSFTTNFTDDTCIWCALVAPVAAANEYYFPHWYNALRVL